ncbi:MAG: hypothetical protein PVF65_06715 [Sphingomonadales bacterium]|jgi:hypothetical protein
MAQRLDPFLRIDPNPCYRGWWVFLSSKHQDYLATVAENISAMRA